MSSDSKKLPKPSKRRRPILSDSDSSDSSFINTIQSKRRVGRVINDGESSDDDSDVPTRPVRKTMNHKLVSDEGSTSDSSASGVNETHNFEGGSTSTEWQSDWESMEESESETINKNKSKCKKATMDISSGSDSGDENAVKCPICLLSFRKQEIGNPAVCEHCFCLECLIEWSKNVNTCPVDRMAFNVINVRAKLGGNIIRYVPIEARNPTEEVIQEDPTYCEVCQRCDREDRMLLCDGCDCGYHLECLDPPMEEVPMDEHWYCSECARNTQNEAEEIEIDLDEVPDLMEEARSLGLMYGRSRAHVLSAAADRLRRRLLPRTRQTERVRETVRTRRAVAASLLSNPQPSTSSGFDSISENSVPGPSSVRAVKPRRTATKRKIKRKTKRRPVSSRRSEEMREVRIQEINADGEIEEIVTYVRAGNNEAAITRRRRKKRKVRRLDDYDD